MVVVLFLCGRVGVDDEGAVSTLRYISTLGCCGQVVRLRELGRLCGTS